MDTKIDYFIHRTDKRLEEIEQKMDRLLAFQAKILGIVIGVSTVATALVNLAFMFLDAHK